jgi:hypothetical protein
MVMKINENILRDALREAIADVTDNTLRPINKVYKQLKEMALKMFNITGGEMAYILNGRTPVDTMSDDVMFKIASILYEFFQSNPSNFDLKKLDVDNYFNDKEKKNYSKKVNRKVVDEDIVFDYYVPLMDDQVSIGLSNKRAAQLASINKIHYEPETQRYLTTIETENGTIQKITIDTKAYNDIYDAMYNGTYIPDLLTFNINPDSSMQPRIVDNKLIIPKESIIDCIDGYHRLKAAIAVTKVKPEWNITFPVMLTGFDVKKAKGYILQEDKKTHLSEEQTSKDDPYDGANFIIDKLSKSLYLKDTNIQENLYTLNKTINQIFKPDKVNTNENIQKAFALYKSIEKNINELIEQNGWIGKSFSTEEWFIYLYLINYCLDNNKDFMSAITKVRGEDLLGQIAITKEASKNHFKIMSEVTKNV